MYKKLPLFLLLSFFSIHLLAFDTVEQLKEKAHSGDVDAQYQLAQRYDFGNGVNYNVRQAEKWYIAAANQGHIEAQFHLAVILQSRAQYTDAIKWYEKSANSGHQRSQKNLDNLKEKLNTEN